MARQTRRFRQKGYVRFLAVAKRSVIIVAKSSGRDLFCENQVDESVLSTRKNLTHLPVRNIGISLSLLQKFESLLRKQ